MTVMPYRDKTYKTGPTIQEHCKSPFPVHMYELEGSHCQQVLLPKITVLFQCHGWVCGRHYRGLLEQDCTVHNGRRRQSWAKGSSKFPFSFQPFDSLNDVTQVSTLPFRYSDRTVIMIARNIASFHLPRYKTTRKGDFTKLLWDMPRRFLIRNANLNLANVCDLPLSLWFPPRSWLR